jgi:hypothetical protein
MGLLYLYLLLKGYLMVNNSFTQYLGLSGGKKNI